MQQLGDFIFTFMLTLFHWLFRKQRISQKKPEIYASVPARISPFSAVKAHAQISGEKGVLRPVADLACASMHLHDTQVFSGAELCYSFGQVTE